jgi:hypothetical protein
MWVGFPGAHHGRHRRQHLGRGRSAVQPTSEAALVVLRRLRGRDRLIHRNPRSHRPPYSGEPARLALALGPWDSSPSGSAVSSRTSRSCGSAVPGAKNTSTRSGGGTSPFITVGIATWISARRPSSSPRNHPPKWTYYEEGPSDTGRRTGPDGFSARASSACFS